MSESNLANKGAAEECLARGRACLQKGDFPAAIRMFEKSGRLFPLPGVDALKARAEAEMKKPPHSARASSNNTGNGHGTSNGSSAPSSGTRPSATPTTTGGGNYRPDQEMGAREILKMSKKSHYEVLGVPRNASEKDINRAYKKLALKYHPDKNQAPSAQAAFQAIQSAVDVLTDKDKRNIYDQVGHENADQAMNGGSGGGGFPGGMRGHGMHFAGGDINPEDLFNMFFQGPGGSGFHFSSGGRGQRSQFFSHRDRGRSQQQGQRGGGQEGQTQGAGGLMQLLQILPIIVLFLMSFGNFGDFGQRQPPYSIHKTSTHRFSSETSFGQEVMPGTRFYMNQELANMKRRNVIHPRDLLEIEKDVDRQYSTFLQHECAREKERNMKFRNKAKHQKDKCNLMVNFNQRKQAWRQGITSDAEFFEDENDLRR